MSLALKVFLNFSRKKPFRFFFIFCKFEKTKMVFCSVRSLSEIFGCKIPAFAKPFSVSGKAMTTQPDRQIGFFLIFCILVIA